MLLPPSRLKNFSLKILGHRVSLHSKIGMTIALKIKMLILDGHVQIGSFNVFRNLNLLNMENGAKIGNLNWISAATEFCKEESNATLIMRNQSAITNRHYLDVSGTIELQRASAIWGVRSTIMTHGISPMSWSQNARKTTIGERSVIGSNSLVVPGTTLPDGCYFGMGSLISGSNYQPHKKYMNSKATSK